MQLQPHIIIPNLINAFNKGDFLLVINTVKQNAAIARADAVVPQLYGSAMRKIGRLDDAAKIFEKGLKLFPQSSDLMNSYGNLLLDKGQTHKAILWFTKALKVKPGAFDYKYNLARAFLVSKRYKDAEMQCHDLLKREPIKSTVLLLIASILIENKRDAEAERYLKKLLD